MYSQLTDFDLSKLLKEGQEKAFSEIYGRYWEKLYIIASKRLNDTSEAEEIVQDIFCRLWRKKESFVLTKGFDHYFAVAVKFEVINRMAKKTRHSVFEKEISSSSSGTDNSTVEELDLKELKRQLQDSINELPEKCRMVFKLKYEKDYTQHQIAQELNISEKTVEAHLSKARKILKGTFKNLLGLLICFL
jgi:RNA polymerase sigma-70 factor (ECF subfamily)